MRKLRFNSDNAVGLEPGNSVVESFLLGLKTPEIALFSKILSLHASYQEKVQCPNKVVTIKFRRFMATDYHPGIQPPLNDPPDITKLPASDFDRIYVKPI